MRPAVLYVDDERPNLTLFERLFGEDFRVLTADGGEKALAVLEKDEVGVVLSDQRMPNLTGIELLARIERQWPASSRVLLTAYSDRDLLLAAITQGHVHDYVIKPWNEGDLRLRIERALEAYVRQRDLSRASVERDALRTAERERGGFSGIVGLGSGLRGIADNLDKIAVTDSTVMIRGESGTGKELIARELHARSRRSGGPFVRSNCAALAEGVLESELFGHEAGAFTGAKGHRAGRFEQADGGTLFLDEIGEVSPAVQVKLLRVIEERELERVGGNRTLRVDVRLIAATNRNLEAMTRDGRFREDFYHRLNVVPLVLPSLRERVQDIQALALHFLERCGSEMGKQLTMTSAAIDRLCAYDWPGNVRELRNVIERAAVIADAHAQLDVADLSFDFASSPVAPSEPSVFAEIDKEEADRLREALRTARGSRSAAARLLNIPRTTLNNRIRRLGIE
jgi:DNA-binding NtrC family response regulator